jgi:hypothetical protein
MIATAAAFSIGLQVSPSWRLKLGLCFLVTFVAWGLKAMAILNGDVTVAEDYLNGLSLLRGNVELAMAVAWTVLCCLPGKAAAMTVVRIKASAQ